MSAKSASLKFPLALAALVVVCGCSALLNKPKAAGASGNGFVAQPAAIQQVYLEIHQLDTGATPPQWDGPVQLSNGAKQDIVLPPLATVRGTVVDVNSVASPNVSVYFAPHGGIPNHIHPPYAVQTAIDGSFNIQLPQDSYSVVMYTASTAGVLPPPQYEDDITVGPDGITNATSVSADGGAIPPALTLTYTLWDPTTVVTLIGNVCRADGADASGIQVSAFDATVSGYGASTSAPRLLSQPVNTSGAVKPVLDCPGEGVFALLMSPMSLLPTSIQLRFSPGTPSGIDFPVITVPATMIQAGVTSVSTALTILPIAAQPVAGSVEDSAGAAVRNAHVYLITQTAGPGIVAPFSYRTMLATDSTGSFDGGVYVSDIAASAGPPDAGVAPDLDGGSNDLGDGGTPNAPLADAGPPSVYYSAIAVPDPSTVTVGGPGLCRPYSAGAGTQNSGSADNALGGSLVPVQTPSLSPDGGTITGTVSEPTQLPPLYCDTVTQFSGVVLPDIPPGTTPPSLVGTTIQAIMEPSAELPDGLSFTTTAGDSDDFTLLLPNGVYDLVFAPPPSTGQPYLIYPAFTVTPALAGETRAFQLPPPFTLTGSLASGTTQNTLAAEIDAYAILGTRAIQIGSAVTSANGSYSLILPGLSQ